MSLNEILKNAELVGKTAAEVLAFGDQTTELSRDTARWTGIGIAKQFNVEAAEGLYATLQALGLNLMAASMAGVGIELSDEKTQENLTLIAAGLRSANDPAKDALADVCEALKEIGITHGTYWQLWEIERPTTEQIDAAIAQNADRDAVTNFANETLNALISSGTKAEIKAAVGAW